MLEMLSDGLQNQRKQKISEAEAFACFGGSYEFF